MPDPKKYCGPYKPRKYDHKFNKENFDKFWHDTVGMIIVDTNGNISAGTSTNGAIHKIPGYFVSIIFF